MQMTDSKTQTHLMLIRHHREQPLKPEFDADGADIWLAILEKTEQGVLAVATEVNAVMNDLTLTQQGQLQKLANVGPRVVGNFVNLGRVLNDADAAKARLKKLLFGPITARPKGDAMIQFLREQEIRRGTSKKDANVTYLHALEADNLEVARALVDWPGGPTITEEIQRRGEAAYAKRTNPAALEKLQAVEYLREHVGSLAEQTAQWLMHLGASSEAVQKAVTAKD